MEQGTSGEVCLVASLFFWHPDLFCDRCSCSGALGGFCCAPFENEITDFEESDALQVCENFDKEYVVWEGWNFG